MKLSKIVILFLSLLLTIGLVACSNAGDTSSKDSGKSEPVTIEYMQVLANPDRDKQVEEMVSAFEEQYPNINVEVNQVPWDQAHQKVLAMGATNSLPAVVETPSQWIVELQSAGYITKLDSYINSWNQKDHVAEMIWDEAKAFSDGEIYTFPYGKWQNAVFYRTDWVEEKGLDAPRTWDDIFTIAEELTEPDKNRYGIAYRGARGGIDRIMEYIYSKRSSGDWYEGDSSIFTDPVTLDAFVEYTKLYEFAPKDSINWGYKEMVEGFNNGTTALLFQTSEVVATSQKNMEEGTWDVVPFPVGEDGKRYQDPNFVGYSISSQVSDAEKDAAWKFISFMNNQENSIKWAKQFLMIPISKEAKNDSFFGEGPISKYVEQITDPATVVTPAQTVPAIAQFRESFADPIVQQYLLGKITAEEAMAKFDEFLIKKK